MREHDTQRDLFGRPVYEPIAGETLPMFHEPVAIERPDNRTAADKLIASKFDATATPNLF